MAEEGTGQGIEQGNAGNIGEQAWQKQQSGIQTEGGQQDPKAEKSKNLFTKFKERFRGEKK